MAEYAGLEIRIGGNTTKLNNALKASTKSAAELQRSIRQITKAMQFDPTNLGNVATRIRLTSDRMESLQSKAQITKTAMQQLGDTMVKFGGNERSIRDIASDTENLSLAAKQADERYVKFGKTLAQIYEAWNNAARDKGADFLKDKMGLTQAEADQLMKSTTTMREFASELERIKRDRSSDITNTAPLISDEDIAKAKELKELNFHDMFKRGLELDEVIKDAENLGVVIEDSAISTVRDLQKTFKEAQQDKEALDKALQFDQMGTDAQRLDSEVESLSQTMRKLDDSVNDITMSPWFQSVETEVRNVDAAIDKLDKDMERTGAALKVDPGNIELATRYFNDMQQKAALGEEKVKLLKQEMDHLSATGAGEAAKQHQDLAKWVEESAENARVAHKEFSEQSAAVANLKDETTSLQQAIKMAKGDELLAGYSDNVLKWKKATEELDQAMEKLAEREQEVAAHQKAFDNAQTAFDNAEDDVERYEKKLEELRAEFERLQGTLDDDNFSDDEKFANFTRMNELHTEIEQVDAAYKTAQANANKFNDKLEEQAEHIKIAKGVLEQQQDAVDELKESVDKLAKTPEVKLFQNPTEEIEKAETELVKLQGELDEAKVKEKELKEAYDSAKTENELAKTAQALRDVSSEADEAQAELKQVLEGLDTKGSGVFNTSTIKSIGMTFSATLTPAITSLGYNMVDASSSIDSAYRDMRKTVEGTEEQFESLKRSAIDFSRTHVTSADQILQIEAIGGELGVATGSLETFAEVISNIDVATNLDTESAATALGHLANILHLTEEDYVGFSDALVRLGNNGASTETEIANIAERIGSMGSIVGMSGSDILALSSTIASTGQNAEAAGTAISRTMSYMETAVAAAGGTMDTSFDAINAAVEEGGDKLTVFASLAGMTAEDFASEWETSSEEMAESIKEQVDNAKGSLQKIADVAHMSADDFAKTWEEDPTEALKAFINGLNDIESAGGSADKVLMDLGIKAVRQKQAIEGLMQTVGGLDNNLQMSEDAWNGVSDKWGKAGDAANEASKKAEGFSGQLQILKNMGQNFLSELGEGAVPWIKMFSGALGDLSKWFSSLSADTKKWLVAVGGIAAALGPALSIGASFANAGKELHEWYDGVTSGMNIVKLAFKHGGVEMVEALSGPTAAMTKMQAVGMELGSTLVKGLAVGAVIAGVAAITYVLMQLHKQYQDHIAATEGLSDAIAGIGEASEVAAAGAEGAGTSIGDFIMHAGQYESRLAELAQTIEDSNKQYGTYAGQMDYYASTVETLGSKAGRTKEETSKLEAALQALNDQCGTTYGLDNYGNIIDTETGKVQENTDVILANIEARKQQALIEYYSDDYAAAIAQQEEARQSVYALAEEYRKLRTEAGKQDWIDNYIEKTGRADLAEGAFREHLGMVKNSLNESKTEFNATKDAVDKLDEKIASATEKMNEANKTIEDAAAAQQEYATRTEAVTADVTGNMKRMSDAIDKAGKTDADFNDIADGLAAISASADDLNNVNMGKLVTAFSDAGGSMAGVIATLEEGGVQLETWNAALEEAPGAAENMSEVTASAFQSMYEIAGEDIGATMTLIAGLDAMTINGKTFYVGDNGSIVDEQGKIYDINADLATIPPEVITMFYGDNKEALQAALAAKASLNDVDRQKATPEISVKDNASATTSAVQGKVDKFGRTSVSATAGIIDKASGTLASIGRDLSSLDGRRATITVTTVKKEVKQATGGLNNRPVIPRHATGYIATGPTLTNQGWIGEDGIEAVANWASGGAVVPLTNKKYMLPIADAIAEGMSNRLGTLDARPQVTISVSGVASPEQVADVIARKLALLGY